MYTHSIFFRIFVRKKSKMSAVFLSLGANIGNCPETFEKSIVLIKERIGTVVEQSPIYRSEPWGFECADWFYNQVIRCETTLSPETVLEKLLAIEKELGRTRNAGNTYESRNIDLDILYFDNTIVSFQDLHIPHKHLQNRKFVLLPLNDIAPDFVHPVLKKTTAELLKNCDDPSVVQPITHARYAYIAIEGVIGVGKTSLATKLSETFGAKLVLESFDANPFLPKFYEDPEKYAFPVELSFMAERFRQLHEHLIAPDLFHDTVVSDYITEKSLIFAGKTLPEDVFDLYSKLFQIIFAALPKPDLLVYLYATPEKLKQNITKRGRDYEKNIEIDYLAQLQDGYLEYVKNISNQRVLIVDVNDLDFVGNPADYNKILNFLQEDYPEGISIRNLQIMDEM